MATDDGPRITGARPGMSTGHGYGAAYQEPARAGCPVGMAMGSRCLTIAILMCR